MSRIIKTVSLDKESDEIASGISNFSKWVRNKLKEEKQQLSKTHTNVELFKNTGLCSPHNLPRCLMCFPHGKPSQDNIKKFNTGYINKEELLELTKIQYDGIIEIIKPTIIEDEPLDPIVKERKYLRRALKYIWSFI